MIKLLLLAAALRPVPPVFCAPAPDRVSDSPADSLLVVFWNVENFFDPGSGQKPQPYWTAGRFRAKCNGIAKTLLRIADRYGRLPDAVGLAEVENGAVLRRLLASTALRKLDYRIIHYDSPDHRGIDCALLARRSTLPLRASAPKHIPDSAGGILPTRDILLAEFDSLAVLVNHHPSQLGGKSDRRELARRRLAALTDSLRAAGTRRILSMGDFNQDLWQDGTGTLKYNGRWEKIDGCFPEGFCRVREEVFADPALLVPDAAFGGTKPRRTFTGPRYTGGISDHLPIVILVYF